jgi:uroporphyrin-III C-methyltransferase/precorrin-2 dehydrogenase/sirohydrochlorin ferrochelatase
MVSSVYHSAEPGCVYLVGAGPGEPDLLTLRAANLLGQADVVVYDNLVSSGVLELVRSDAELIYAGKRRSEHTMRQDEINQLLVQLAKEKKRVVRLKGGDPFIFGRGGEEMQVLASHSVPFEVVPGVTAACGVSTHAGIPLTHRSFAQAVRFVTGHLQEGGIGDLDWVALSRPHQTVVVYMGLNALPRICEQLIAHGANAQMPIAVIQHGTLASQKVVVGTLGDVAGKVVAARLKSPSLLIVGEVVGLHEDLSWFGRLSANQKEHQFSGSHAELVNLHKLAE